MAALFHVTILSCKMKVFEGDLESLVAPGEIGYIGILANHAPLMTTLIPGKISLRGAGGKLTDIEIKAGGFLEVSNNNATILLDPDDSLS